ncbi:unnamed protein product [Nippostrongylus brasiliensis]|uniref:Formin-like protein CG32138 (inferred by orthology to a D. melanogaster protein) n=1 Tax=Nippostrongylus brasiliensis TaxID=27835 RepID=A0A0N4YU92_NIPBR|nr:unnamed protein product [Nippostrongylus brasiliensis]
MAAVHQMDLKTLPADKVDILSRILPNDEERKLYAERGDDEALSDEDRFMAALCEIERLEHKLSVMRVMADFDESVELLEPQFTHVTAASKCAREATMFHRVLEVILAFGNYMNSGRKGSVYGFRLASLDSLAIMKSPSDRSLTLLHMVVDSIEKSFPDLMKFGEQLKFIDKASGVQWDSVLSDMKELETGFEMARKERALKGENCPAPLADFLNTHDERMKQLQEHAKLAVKTYETCIEFYGESARTMPPNDFFSKLSKFTVNFNRCKQENDAKAAAEKRQRDETERRSRAANKSQQHDGIMRELAERVGNGNAAKRQRGKIDSQQIGHGDFEKLMSGLKQTYPVSSSSSAPTPTRRKVSSSPSPAPRVGPPVAAKTRVVAMDRDRQ